VEKLNILFEVYHKFSLTYTNAPSWMMIYREFMDISDKLRDLTENIKELYSTHKSIEEYFKAIDKLYEQNKKDIDFIQYYSLVDARSARTLAELLKIYINTLSKTRQNLIEDIINTQEEVKLPLGYILTGYFQDGYYLRYKKSILKGRQSRAPPEVVYLGGGGKATTTFLMTILAKTAYKIACIISSSDDGGSSWKIMKSLFNRLGFYFIPPGDAAGLSIFLSNDAFKIFTLFWAESEEETLSRYMLSRGRVSADSLYPVWIKRIEEALYLTEKKPKDIEKILPLLKGQKLEKPADLIIFLSSIINLGELLDRE
jgi:hypothetical protein